MTRLFFAVLLALVPAVAPAAEPPDWSEVSAIFTERCIMCHSATGAARGLRLDSFDGAMTGSERGVVLVAGDAAKSELIRRLRGESAPRMPFLGRPLAPEQIDLIARWIDAGLPHAAP